MGKEKSAKDEWIEGVERDAAWSEMGKKSKQWNEEVEKKGCLGALFGVFLLFSGILLWV